MYRSVVARTLKIKTELGNVSGSMAMPANPRPVGILLAHGAGAGRTHPWMVAMQSHLVHAGFPTLTFNYLYTEEGRKAPDRLPKLIPIHAEAARRLNGYVDSVVLAGKSMGGRVGGHVVASSAFEADGLVFLGYPLVAMGKKEPRDTAHLRSLTTPMLFVSGTRDPMGPTDLVGEVAASVPKGELVTIEGGDHSLVPLKSSGKTLEDSLASATMAIQDWIAQD